MKDINNICLLDDFDVSRAEMVGKQVRLSWRDLFFSFFPTTIGFFQSEYVGKTSRCFAIVGLKSKGRRQSSLRSCRVDLPALRALMVIE